MAPVDVPPVPSRYTPIITPHLPTTSATVTAALAGQLYRKAEDASNTGTVSAAMQEAVDAYSSGVTPSAIRAKLSTEQQQAFDDAWSALQRGQGASIAAQDIWNTRIKLNGVVTTLEAQVDQLVASYAGSGGPNDPKNQEEFTRKYNELIEKAKSEAQQVGSNHKQTQDSLMGDIQAAKAPTVPSTMTPTDSSSPSVPGMPQGALGSILQNVAGKMVKPPNIPMPQVGKLTQPAAQAASAALKDLMGSKQDGGVPISKEALAKLTTKAGLEGQGASLSKPGGSGRGDDSGRDAGTGAPVSRGLGGPAADKPGSTAPGAHTQTVADDSGTDDGTGGDQAGKPDPVSPAGGPPSGDAGSSPPPASPAVTPPQPQGPVATTLSSGDSAVGPSALSGTDGVSTHTASGDVGTTAPASLSHATAAAPGAGTGAPAMAPMTPMMGGMGGMAGMGGGRGSGSGGEGIRRVAGTDTDSASAEGNDQRKSDPDPESAFDDIGTDKRGLQHATDDQHSAASVAAAIARMHLHAGVSTHVAVGVSAGRCVFATSDGLGFLFPGTRGSSWVTPLISHVPDGFITRWLGCDQPARPLLDAVSRGLIAPFDAVVSTDDSPGLEGVTVLDRDVLATINITPAMDDRSCVDAVDAEDVHSVMRLLTSAWGLPRTSPAALEEKVRDARWRGEGDSSEYLKLWASYLVATAAIDLETGDVDGARYVMRSALRIPVPEGVSA